MENVTTVTPKAPTITYTPKTIVNVTITPNVPKDVISIGEIVMMIIIAALICTSAIGSVVIIGAICFALLKKELVEEHEDENLEEETQV